MLNKTQKNSNIAKNNQKRFFYSLPVGATAMLYGGPLVVLQGIYAKYYGLSLTTIASILLIARLFDTVTDPIIGYCSDRYHARTGTRKPFVAAGGILFIVGAYGLFIPPDNVDAFYTLIAFLIFYLGFTLFNIPHYAWGNEISRDSDSSTRLFTMRSLMMAAGGMIFYSLPQLPFFPSTEFTPEVLQWAVIIAGVLLLPALYACVVCVPNTYQDQPQKLVTQPRCQASINSSQHTTLRSLWNSIIYNKPMLLFLGAFISWGLGIGSWSGLLFIFIDSYLGMGKNFSLLALIGMGCSILGIRVWSAIALRFGKVIAWIISTVATGASMLSLALLTPDDPSFTILVMAMALAFLGAISVTIFAPALLSDIVDYSAWKFGSKRAGSYFSLYFLFWKANEAIGIALGLAIAGWFGFDPSASSHAPQAVWGLKLAAIWMPSLLFLLSIIFIYRIPINARRHAIICKALARREERQIQARASGTLTPQSNSGALAISKAVPDIHS